jgi:hypothetical protein
VTGGPAREDDTRRYWEGYRDGYDDGTYDRRNRDEPEPPEAMPAGPDYPTTHRNS